MRRNRLFVLHCVSLCSRLLKRGRFSDSRGAQPQRDLEAMCGEPKTRFVSWAGGPSRDCFMAFFLAFFLASLKKCPSTQGADEQNSPNGSALAGDVGAGTPRPAAAAAAAASDNGAETSSGNSPWPETPLHAEAAGRVGRVDAVSGDGWVRQGPMFADAAGPENLTETASESEGGGGGTARRAHSAAGGETSQVLVDDRYDWEELDQLAGQWEAVVTRERAGSP